MTYWEQECGDKSLHDTLGAIINNKDVQILEDDKELFRTLKRHLTRKELHAFCMKEGGKSSEEIVTVVNAEDIKDVELLLHKAQRKIKQAKVTGEIFIKDAE